MRSWKRWLACLGLAGACMTWSGCGGGAAPDPEEGDAQASAPAGPAPPPEAPAAADPAAPAAPPGPEAAPQVAGGPGMPGPAAPAAPPGAAEAPAAEPEKPANSSATAEMLALGNTNPPSGASGSSDGSGGSSPGAPGASPGGPGGAFPMPPGAGGGPPGAPGSPPGYPGAAGSSPPGYPGAAGSSPPGYPGANGAPTAPPGPPAGYPGANTAPGAPGTGPPTGYPGPNTAPGMPPGYPGAPGSSGSPGAPPAYPGAGDSAGGPGGGGDGGKADFSNQYSAVQAFLAAVKAKDPERVKEATALHAGQEAETRAAYRKLFLSILDESVTPDDLDELAKKLEGFQIAYANQAKSSGRLGIVLSKSEGGGAFLQRTITVRREKSGWKVVDISGEGKLEKPVVMPRGGMRGGRRR